MVIILDFLLFYSCYLAKFPYFCIEVLIFKKQNSTMYKNIYERLS